MTTPLSTSYGLCYCGCGQKTHVAPKTNNKLGHKAGEPVHYISGHWARVRSAERRLPGWEIVIDGVICMTIPLTQEQFAIVDTNNYARLAVYKWCAIWCEGTQSFYASRYLSLPSGKRTTLTMHREVKGLWPGDVDELDHWNGDTLDNRETNLRVADWSQNMCNRKIPANNTSGVKGVCLEHGLWRSYLMLRGQRVHDEYHATRELAIAARFAAELEYHKEFALIRRRP
jgi:hypothetical protein